MLRLVLRLDPIAALRPTPGARTPDLHAAAHAALLGGAEAVRLRLGEEAEAAELCRRLNGPLQLDLTLAPAEIEAAIRIKPERACLLASAGVPEAGAAAAALERLAKAGVPSALRLPASDAAVLVASEAGAVWVDLDTAPFSRAASEGARLREFLTLQKAVTTARELGLRVTVGGGLDAALLPRIATLRDVEELHVGFGALARALFTGLTQAVRDLRQELVHAEAEQTAETGD